MLPEYYSVTTVIGFFLDKRWFNKEACERGTRVHLMCETNIDDPLDSGIDVPTDLAGYYESFMLWKSEAMEDQIVMSKEPKLSCDELKITGHPDLVLASADDVKDLTLIDYKTSKNKQPWWRLQLAAYKYMIDQSTTIKGVVNKYGSLRIRPGKKPLYNSYEDTYVEDIALFINALKTAEFFKLWNWKEYNN